MTPRRPKDRVIVTNSIFADSFSAPAASADGGGEGQAGLHVRAQRHNWGECYIAVTMRPDGRKHQWAGGGKTRESHLVAMRVSCFPLFSSSLSPFSVSAIKRSVRAMAAARMEWDPTENGEVVRGGGTETAAALQKEKERTRGENGCGHLPLPLLPTWADDP